MISLFLGAHKVLVPFLTPTNDMIGHIKNLDLDPLDLLWTQLVCFLQFQDSLQGRLRVKLSVVLLDVGASYSLEVLILRVNLKRSGNSFLETFVAFENLKRTGNPSHGEEGCVSGTKNRVGIGQALPIGEASSTGDPQGVESGATDSNGIRSSVLVKAQGTGYSSCHCIGTLGRMIKSFSSHGSNIREPALDLVGDRQGSQELLAALLSVLACRQHCSQVVAGVAGLLPGNVAIVVVQVANQGRIVESGPVWCIFISTDQRNERLASKIFELGLEYFDRGSFHGPNCTAQRI